MDQDLERLADRYRGEGYAVVVRPRADDLPPFARDFRVEIVGRRGGGGVLVAARRNRTEVAADDGLPRSAGVTAAQPGWRFDLAILEAEDPAVWETGGAAEFSGDDIARSLAEAEDLGRVGFHRAAVVVAWGALEAAMRMRLRAAGQRTGWGTGPRQLLAEVYSAGALAPDEFRRAEAAAQLRNQIVHGFTSRPDDDDAAVPLLADVARRLVRESQPGPQPA